MNNSKHAAELFLQTLAFDLSEKARHCLNWRTDNLEPYISTRDEVALYRLAMTVAEVQS